MMDFDAKEMYRLMEKFREKLPVKPEIMGERSLAMSQYVRKHLRPSKPGLMYGGIDLGGFLAYDLDWVLYDYRNNLLQLIEAKSHGARVKFPQSDVLNTIDRLLRAGASVDKKVTYLGLNHLEMSGERPDDSDTILWNGKKIDKRETWIRLNMIDHLYKDKAA